MIGPAMIGASIINGVANMFGASKNAENQAESNRINQENMIRQEQLQREFAQSGIQWKVQDAEKAGIHPLYALGANTVSYSPNVVGHVADTSVGNAIAKTGQDFSRAIEATATKDTSAFLQASQAQQLEKGGLENELLRVNIAKMRGQIGPNMPGLNDGNVIDGQPATRSVNLPGIGKLTTPKSESQQDDISKEYGDEGLPQIPGQYRFLRDNFSQGREKWKQYWGGKSLYEYLYNPNRKGYFVPPRSDF